MTRRAPATERLTVAQALVRFLAAQRVERDGVERPFFAGVFGIFGHGNVAGIGQALQQYASRLRYYQSRNEQAQVHAAAAYARMTNRLQILACTSSVGPGATNMVTGAAGATINRLPVLLLPGDVFATRRVGTVLQQLEAGWSQEVSVNDAFRPVSRYWDRISRPEQLIHAALEAMRVLTSQAETGAVTLALPQDVQAEAFDWPAEFLRRADLAHPPATAGPGRAGSRGRSDPAVGAAADRRGRRRHLLRGDRGAPRAGRDHRDPGGGDAGREGLAFLRPPVEPRRHGSHRHTRRQPYRARGRPGNRHRHAVQRLHHRVADRISARGRPVRQPQHRRARRLQARGSRAAGRCPGYPRGPPRVTRRLGRWLRPGARPRRDTTASGTARWNGSTGSDIARCSARAKSWAPSTEAPRRRMWSYARPAVCRGTCTSCGGPGTPKATTSSTATPAWATKSPAGSG